VLPQPVFLDYHTCFYVFPPNNEGIVKFAIHAVRYENDSPSLANTARVSVPRTKLFRGSLDDHIPKEALKELRGRLAMAWPELAKKKIVETRMCW
jgi:sarcosine oxidase/L-pipecolate oxidase